MRLYPNSSAYHGSDMHALFGNSEEVSGLSEEDAQTELTRVVMDAWAAFARDPSAGLHDLGWGEYADGKIALRSMDVSLHSADPMQIPWSSWASTKAPHPALSHRRSMLRDVHR